jgi:hypothetical protein
MLRYILMSWKHQICINDVDLGDISSSTQVRVTESATENHKRSIDGALPAYSWNTKEEQGRPLSQSDLVL